MPQFTFIGGLYKMGRVLMCKVFSQVRRKRGVLFIVCERFIQGVELLNIGIEVKLKGRRNAELGQGVFNRRP